MPKIHQKITKDPESCYQANAAQTSFKNAMYVAIAITTFSILGIPTITAILKIMSQKVTCCKGVFENLAASESTTTALTILPSTADNPSKIVNTKLLTSLTTAIPSAVSAVSIGWLFDFWEASNRAQAACDYDQAK